LRIGNKGCLVLVIGLILVFNLLNQVLGALFYMLGNEKMVHHHSQLFERIKKRTPRFRYRSVARPALRQILDSLGLEKDFINAKA
jgi:hypothetical protein